jgi:hypothetical protein
MPSLFDQLHLKSTLKEAIKGAATGAKMAAVKKLSASGEVQKMATEAATEAAASAAGGKLLDVWKNYKGAIIAAGIGIPIAIIVLITMAFRKR